MTHTKTAYIFDVYDDYAVRLKYVRDVLEEQGYQTAIYLADFDHFHKEKYRTKREDAKYIEVMPYKKNFSYARIRSHMKFAEACLKIQKEHPADLCYVMVPPNSMARQFGMYRKKNPSFKLIFDLCDMWPESFPTKGLKTILSVPFGIWAWFRNSSMKYGDLIMSECDLFADILKDYLPSEKTETFWLCRPQKVKEILPVSSEVITFAYLGSINNVVDVDSIVSVLSEVKKRSAMNFHIIGDGEQRERMLKLLDENNIPYEYHGLVFDEEEKKKIFAQCHYGFNMMRDTTCIGLTMKSLDYLAYDLPLINNVPADTWNLVEKKKIGFNVKDFAQAAEEILHTDETTYESMRKNVIDVFSSFFDDSVFKTKMHSALNRMR